MEDTVSTAHAVAAGAGTDWWVVVAFIVSVFTLLFVWRQLEAALDTLKLAGEANQRIGEGERLLATHQLIIKLETDREHLEARGIFASIRDGKLGDISFDDVISDYQKNGKKEPTSEVGVGAPAVYYPEVIRYLNIMEMTSVGIQTGCYDEESLSLWQRGVYVRNFTATKTAIESLRSKNNRPRTFLEVEKLACHWADDGEQSEMLGGQCAKYKEEFKITLQKFK